MVKICLGDEAKLISSSNKKKIGVLGMDRSRGSVYSMESMATQKSKHFLFYYLLKQFQSIELKDRHLLAGVSGGIDSMVLLSVLLEMKKVLNLNISVVHVHHGAENKLQKKFQNQAAETVKNFCMENNIRCYCNKSVYSVNAGFLKKESKEMNFSSSSVVNEAEMRKYRYEVFLYYIEKSKADYLVLAHTANDLLETRLIRLIRGTGGQGLKSMFLKKGRIVRPFISINRSRIADYSKKRKIKWCEDPSNQSPDYSFRNWIRNEWLPQLERKRTGSVETMSRSLNLIAHTANSEQKRIRKICRDLIKNQLLKRNFSFSLEDKQKILAYYMKKQGLKNYRASHIMELLKQMNRPQKEFTFSLLGKTWKMSARWLQPL